MTTDQKRIKVAEFMKSKKLKTKNNPEGRNWPNEIVLDVGSNMPCDVYGVQDNAFGVRYIRHDIATQDLDSILSDAKVMVKPISIAKDDYSHSWPNEDALTAKHRIDTLELIDKALSTPTAKRIQSER